MNESGRIVDALGMHCPVPLRLLGDALRRHPDVRRFELRSDDPLIAVDLPAWCHRRGHRLLTLHEAGGEWRGIVDRGDTAL